MAKLTIKPTTSDDIRRLAVVLDGTDRFPSEMLVDMLAPASAGDTEAFWLTCHQNGEADGFCYTVPEFCRLKRYAVFRKTNSISIG